MTVNVHCYKLLIILNLTGDDILRSFIITKLICEFTLCSIANISICRFFVTLSLAFFHMGAL